METMTHDDMVKLLDDLQNRVQKLEYAISVLKSDNDRLMREVKVQQYR